MTALVRFAIPLVLLAALATPAHAETRRLAVLVGHNAGSEGQPALRWAEDDAGKLADVFVQLGDIRPGDLFLVQGKGAARVRDALAAATTAVRAARRVPDDRVVMYFYYSGHSDGTAIELGGERISFAELKALLAATGADVRVLIIDACKSGALVAKGGRRGPAFSVDLVDDLTTRGEAMLTSSAADEQSLESSEIRGSFFTHHLVSGLRGAADASGDGRITLSEAYDYAFGKTVTASAATGSTPQHPSYDYRLSGRGELVLTDVGARTAAIELPTGFDRALVVAVQRDQIIAEVTRDTLRRVAVAPGSYAVRLWRNGSVAAGRVAASEGSVAPVRWDDLAPIDLAPPPAKGDRIARKDEGELSPAAQTSYDANMLWFGENTTLLIRDSTAAVVQNYATYVGKYRREITLDDFYLRVGRSDLAQAYLERRRLKNGLYIAGAALVAAGLVYYAYKRCGENPSTSDPRFSTCIDDDGAALTVLVGASIIGSSIFISGGWVRNQPAPPDEMRRMTDEYNARLRARLRTLPAPPSIITASLVPYVIPGGGGGMLIGRF
jgi:hypothetical protein